MTRNLKELARDLLPQLLKERFEVEKVEGCECPLCGQYAKVYKRKLNSNMAMGLIKLYRYAVNSSLFDTRDFFHISEFLGKGMNSSDFAKLRYWGLIEELPLKKVNDKRTSGMWRITRSGIAFAENAVAIHSHVLLYNGDLLGYTHKAVNIKQCIGSKFNYTELITS